MRPESTTTGAPRQPSPAPGTGSSGGGGGGGWSDPGVIRDTSYIRPGESYKKPLFPGGRRTGAGGARDGAELGQDAPYMFQRGAVGPLGMDAFGPTAVGAAGGVYTWGGGPGGESGFQPWGGGAFVPDSGGGGDTGGGSDPTAVGGGGGGGGGGAGGGAGVLRKKPQQRNQLEMLLQMLLGHDGYMDQPNNFGSPDYGMRSGDNPSSVGPFKAPPRPPSADATQWGNW